MPGGEGAAYLKRRDNFISLYFTKAHPKETGEIIGAGCVPGVQCFGDLDIH
jgi:hypothetical protein